MKINKYMIGTDFSHNNTIDLSQCGNQGFVFLKATEGATYKDSNMELDLKEITDNVWGVPPFIGFYHYARPEYNTPRSEATNYLNKIKPHIGNCMCALDCEGAALNVKNIEKWVLEWLHSIKAETQSTPILYVQASAVKMFPNVINSGFPLWVACYSQDSRVGKYKSAIEKATFIQITSHPFDIDLFSGTPVDMVNIIKGTYRKGVPYGN